MAVAVKEEVLYFALLTFFVTLHMSVVKYEDTHFTCPLMLYILETAA